MKQFIVILLALAMTSCGPTTRIYIMPEDGKIDEKKPDAMVKQSAAGAAVYEKLPDGTIKVQVDTRVPTAWDKFIAPIIKSAASRSQETVEVN